MQRGGGGLLRRLPLLLLLTLCMWEVSETERDERQTDESVPRYDVAFHKIVKNHSTSLNNRPPHHCNQPDCGHRDHTVIQINKQWHNERSLPLCAGKSFHLIHLQPPVSLSSIPVPGFLFVLQHPHMSCRRNGPTGELQGGFPTAEVDFDILNMAWKHSNHHRSFIELCHRETKTLCRSLTGLNPSDAVLHSVTLVLDWPKLECVTSPRTTFTVTKKQNDQSVFLS